MSKRLLILGGSFPYLGCIREALDMGLHVLVADRNPHCPGFGLAHEPLHIDITDQDGILAAAKARRIDGIIAVNDFGVRTAAEVAHALGLPGISPECARICTDKLLMRQAWARHGVPQVEFEPVSSPDELRQAAVRLGYPLIIKPRDSRGGGCRGVRRLDSDADLEAAWSFADSFYRDGRLLVERFAEGTEHSAEVLVRGGVAHVVAVSDNVKLPPPYRVNEAILYPSALSGARLAELHEAIIAAVRAVGLEEGVAHVELAMTASGPALFELGARCGGGAPAPLVPFLCGVREFAEAARIALGQPAGNLRPQFMRGCALAFLYPKPGIVREVHVPAWITENPGVLAFSVFRRPGEEVLPTRTCLDRAGMVITGMESVAEAYALARKVVRAVTIVT